MCPELENQARQARNRCKDTEVTPDRPLYINRDTLNWKSKTQDPVTEVIAKCHAMFTQTEGARARNVKAAIVSPCRFV